MYENLPRNMQRRINETQLHCHVIQPGTPHEVMFNIFKRINTTGMPLSPQEIRHALNPGKARRFLKKLTDSQAFKQATNRSINDKRMADRECVLRFLAFYRTPPGQYKSNLDIFLGKAMQDINNLSDEEYRALEYAFRNAMDTAQKIFKINNEQYAFRKQTMDRTTRSPINKPLFETWSVSLAKLSDEQRQLLVDRKGNLNQKFIKLIQDPEFDKSISLATGTANRVRTRFHYIEQLIQEVLA